MTKDNERCPSRLFLKRGPALGDGLHGHEFRAFDLTEVMLEGLADVNEDQFLAGIETPFHIFDSDFHLREYS